jgi:large subunit ribosomal protein L29
MKASELKDLSADDLRAKAAELEESLFRMRIQKSMGQLDVPIKLRSTRRDLARVNTELRQKQA